MDTDAELQALLDALRASEAEILKQVAELVKGLCDIIGTQQEEINRQRIELAHEQSEHDRLAQEKWAALATADAQSDTKLDD